MKTLIYLVAFTVTLPVFIMKSNAQIKMYEIDWKTVQDNISKGLPASALETAKKIYKKAKAENQNAQVIKSLMYITQLQQENREENLVQSIKEIEQEISGSKEPAISLLNSYLAGLYQQYFAINRYKLYSRTNTVDFKKDDMATWTTDDFHKKITTLYLASLKNEKLLQQTKLESYDALITKGNVRYLRPTLYDILAHRALNYFKSDERDITRPAYKFEIDQPEAFAPAKAFTEAGFSTKDSLSLQHKALLIYQDLIRFHLNDAKPDALIDVDLARLEYVNAKAVISVDNSGPLYIIDGSPAPSLNISPAYIESVQVLKDVSATAVYGSRAANGVVIITTKTGAQKPINNAANNPASLQIENKDILYYNALKQITDKYGNIPAAAQASFLMAQWHQQNGNKYNANGDTTYRYELVRAKEITDKILQQKEESEGWINAYNLGTQLTASDFSFEIEKVNIPDLPFRMLVHYKNISKIYLRVIPATEALKNAIQDMHGENKYWPQLTGAKAFKSWEQVLPHNTDLQNHSAEIKIDALPAGEYFVAASVDNDFSSNNNILAAKLIYVSNISFVTANNEGFVLHRNTGQPLAHANIQVWKRSYDYKTSSYKKEKFEKYLSDQNGSFALATTTATAQKRGNNALLFEIQHNNDKLFMDEENYNYYYNNLNIDRDKAFASVVFLFTDRSIYRPGQTVYFKGISINKRNDGRNATVYEGYKNTLSLYDANNQKLSDIAIVSNEYGSFNGKFTLPQGGLNGMFSIRTGDGLGRASFRMEEYKRPKFYVDFDKIKGAYKVNEEVKVTASAKAYAGNNVDGATVKYRVVREARFPYPWLFWRGYWPQSQPVEITHGETQTDANGKFEITFQAIPDLKLDKKTDPVFDYRIYADVTDINGETRSNNQLVSAGYKSLLLKVDIANRILADSLKNIHIRTENMSGEFEKANIRITVTKLKPEQRLLRNRYWEKPDQFVMSKEEYISLFPNDIYNNEDEPQTWERTSVVLQQEGTTDSIGIFALDKTTLEPGYYVIETTTKDKDGNEIKDVQYTELYTSRQKQPSRPAYLLASSPEEIAPGEKTNIEITTSASNVFLIRNINKKDNAYSYHVLNNENKRFDFIATEDDRGGYGVNFLFVKNNRIFQSNQTIAIPWTNKELNIEYSTFREKTLPGSEERWTVKISGYKKEKVAAEMMASMYDASLDQFYPHQWNKPYIWSTYYNRIIWSSQSNFGNSTAIIQNTNNNDYKSFDKQYDQLFNDGAGRFELSGRVPGIMVRGAARDAVLNEVAVVGYGAQKKQSVSAAQAVPAPAEADMALEERAKEADNGKEATEDTPSAATKVRTNFNETAFFFPDLKTDKDGNVNFTFTMPEALTRWKFQALTHTKELAIGYSSKEIITQKDLMVQPNPPRFLREGDKMDFSSKVVNLSDKEMTGIATLQLFDAATDEPIDGWFKNAIPQQYFTISAGQSQAIQFPIEVPYHYSKALTWRIVAKTDSLSSEGQRWSDGEENILPVLTNRMLVTETLPLNMRGNGTKNFKLDKLINSGNSETLITQSLTIEYTSNPAWYAVQALPYMMEYPYECAEQTWNRYYANSLATTIANSSPKIKSVFEQWKTVDTAALLSNLQKNEELKSVLLEEAPWVLQAKNEAQQKKNIAVLFDLVRMSGEQSKAYDKLKQMQSANGGFVWFKGGPDDRFITQYIITGIGHLKKLKAVGGLQEANLNRITQAALPYLDAKIKEEYENLLKYKTDPEKYTPSYYVIQYLYMRSFFPQNKIASAAQKAVSYFTERAQKTWTKQNKYMQAMIALTMHRKNNAATSTSILQSLKETAINNEELGMYYKDAGRSWWWYDAPIERQALVIEAFEEAGKDSKTADNLRTWLLKNKQTNNWESTKATAEAVYALLLRGTEWLSAVPEVKIDLGGTTISSEANNTEAGTGYFKKIIEGNEVRPAMGNISVTVQQQNTASSMPTWGGVYWQYFEDLDKITTAATPLQLSKKLFVESNTDHGPVLKPIIEGDVIKVGDKIKVRIELRVDRDMEYVHMKDMRASSFEPANVLSHYKWQGGLGYYETTKDASTNFFFNYLPKGTYVFEYSLYAGLAGNFSNGITSIQCMYAPEFSSHSEGVRVIVK